MKLCLDHNEIIELTHRVKYSAQRKALNMMGIDHKVRPDGTIAVFVDSLVQQHKMKEHKHKEPNFGAAR